MDFDRLTISQILDNCTLDELDIDTSKLEFKTDVVDGNFIISGFFRKGKKYLTGIGRRVVKNNQI